MFLVSYGPRSVGRGDYWRPPGPNFAGDPGVPWEQKLAHGLDPLRGSRTIKILASPKVSGDVLALSVKLTELTESSPSVPPPSVLCGSGIPSQLASPSMASSGHFDPSQTYEGYKAVEVLDPSCTECLAKGKGCLEHYNPGSSKCHYCYIGKKPCCQTGRQVSNVRRYLWSKKDGLFGKEFPVSEAPTSDATSGYSALTGSRQRDVARWTNVGGPLP
ncbi:hypothetical protein O181_078560, partial [Austropuccinia psidii MF-1]|nr:hypothetical protein [Austropuccinia psidii MF-1]